MSGVFALKSCTLSTWVFDECSLEIVLGECREKAVGRSGWSTQGIFRDYTYCVQATTWNSIDVLKYCRLMKIVRSECLSRRLVDTAIYIHIYIYISKDYEKEISPGSYQQDANVEIQQCRGASSYQDFVARPTYQSLFRNVRDREYDYKNVRYN